MQETLSIFNECYDLDPISLEHFSGHFSYLFRDWHTGEKLVPLQSTIDHQTESKNGEGKYFNFKYL